MYKGKKVSNLELKNALLKSLELNDSALDYIKNNIIKTKNFLGFNPDDDLLKKELESEEYIEFSLNYLDNQYSSQLKKLGVRL